MVWEDTNICIAGTPGAGNNGYFWTDNRIDVMPLKHMTFVDIAEEEAKRLIKDFVGADGQWNYSLFEELLPSDVVAKIQSLQPPSPDDGDKSCYWNLTPSDEFSVSFAYTAAQELKWSQADNRMNWVWKWPGGQRVKMFFWLALKGKLVTNAERFRRHTTPDATYAACKEQIEDIDHVLLYCALAAECWNLINPYGTRTRGLQTSFVDWMFQNLNPMNNGQVWRAKFGLLC